MGKRRKQKASHSTTAQQQTDATGTYPAYDDELSNPESTQASTQPSTQTQQHKECCKHHHQYNEDNNEEAKSSKQPKNQAAHGHNHHSGQCNHAQDDNSAVYDANAGVVPIQPGFDISEANVQRNGAKQGQSQAATQTKAKQPVSQAQQQNVQHQNRPAHHYPQRPYHNMDPQSKQPVVTMHDYITQDQSQRVAQQQQQMQQQQQTHQQDMGGTDADDEECDEDSDDDDTENEDYGPEEGQEDDMSEDVDDAAEASNQPNHSNQCHQGYNQQYSQPGYQGQPEQYQNQPAHQQNQQQPTQQNQGQQTRSSGQYGHHQIQEVENKLHSSLTDMLINLYNGKGTDEYKDHYATVVSIIDDQKNISQQTGEKEMDADTLARLFQQKIESIVGTVKDKLYEDAKKDSLVFDAQPPQPAEKDQQARKNQPQKVVQLSTKDYRGDLQAKFDEILSAVGDYFDLFKNNTDKLEDLWLQLLDYVKVKNTSQYRIFKQTHYQIYIRKVIKNNVIQKIIEEASRWVGTPNASKVLAEHLEKIKQIEQDSQFLPDSYENFHKKTYLEFDLNEHTRQYVDRLKQQQKIEKRNKQNVNTQAHGNQQFSDQTPNANCSNDFQDCKQFQNHYNNTKGQCKCRCQAINCIIDHFGLNCQGKRGNAKRGNMGKNQSKKFEAVAEQYEFGDEQVYNKNLDDLMDYIMQPEGKKKKKGKKRKGAKDDSDEEKIGAKVVQTNPAQGKANEPQTAKSQATGESSVEKGGGGVQSSRRAADRSSSAKSGDHKGSPESRSGARNATNQPAPGEQPEPNPASDSSDGESQEEVSRVTSDEQFDTEMEAFAKQLEEQCQEKVNIHARKLKPNFEEQWILKLKLRLQMLENRSQHSSTSAPAASSKTAPPANAQNRKH